MEMVMTTIRSYRDLDAWQAGMELLLIIYNIASQLPQIERFELASQMRRAAVSIPSNVAEGQAYGPSARYLHHVRVALGSLAELDTHLEAILRIGYLRDQVLKDAIQLVDRTGQLLHGLERSLKLRQARGWAFALAGLFGFGAAFLLS
jgi:four helix bundle protein